MATLRSLYRARRGDSVEQVENFLSAALGLLFRSSQGARERLAPLFGLPIDAEIRVSAQDLLYDGSNVVGRTDLRFDFRSGSAVRSVIIEAKFGAHAEREQLERYVRAVRDHGEVYLVSLRGTDVALSNSAGARHVTWQRITDLLDGVPGALAADFLGFMAEQGVIPARRVSAARISTAKPAVADAFSAAVKALIPKLVPSPHDATVRSLLADEWGHEDGDAGYLMDCTVEQARRASLATATVGITAHRTELRGMTLSAWTSPTTKALRSVLLEHAWVREDEDYLRADLGTYWPDAHLADVLREAATRARAAMTVHGGPSARNGYWAKKATSPIAVPAIEGTIGDLYADAEAAATLQAAADGLSWRWLRSLHNELGGLDGCYPISRHHNGSFYARDRSIQVGASVYPGEGEQALFSWVWFRDRSLKQRFVSLAAERGWGVQPDGNASPKTVVLCPPVPPETELDGSAADALGVSLGELIKRVHGSV